MRSRILSTAIYQKLMVGQLSVADTFWFGFAGVFLILNLLTLVLAGPVTALSLSIGAWAGKTFSVVWLQCLHSFDVPCAMAQYAAPWICEWCFDCWPAVDRGHVGTLRLRACFHL
jgi:hypothetical protein